MTRSPIFCIRLPEDIRAQMRRHAATWNCSQAEALLRRLADGDAAAAKVHQLEKANKAAGEVIADLQKRIAILQGPVGQGSKARMSDLAESPAPAPAPAPARKKAADKKATKAAI